MTGKEKHTSDEFFFKIIYTNATSLNNKIMELEQVTMQRVATCGRRC